MKHRTEITFEMEETIVIRDARAVRKVFCPNCKTIVDMATPHVVATISGGSEREIFRLIEAGLIHAIEAERVLICLRCMPILKRDADVMDLKDESKTDVLLLEHS